MELAYIIHMDISFVDYLDYLDIKQLCKTNKNIQKACNNTVLKLILTKNLDIVLPQNINVIDALTSIYNEFEKLYYLHYSKLPIWVDPKKFKNHMIKEIRDIFIVALVKQIQEKGLLPIEIYQDSLCFPLYSNKIDMKHTDLSLNICDLLDNYGVNNNIVLVDKFEQYIIPTIDNINTLYDLPSNSIQEYCNIVNKRGEKLHKALYKLLFIID